VSVAKPETQVAKIGMRGRTSNDQAKGVEFYIPLKPVVKENAETTKLRKVYDASAKAHADTVSFYDCLNPGPCAAKQHVEHSGQIESSPCSSQWRPKESILASASERGRP
jgi:hypothetical protein